MCRPVISPGKKNKGSYLKAETSNLPPRAAEREYERASLPTDRPSGHVGHSSPLCALSQSRAGDAPAARTDDRVVSPCRAYPQPPCPARPRKPGVVSCPPALRPEAHPIRLSRARELAGRTREDVSQPGHVRLLVQHPADLAHSGPGGGQRHAGAGRVASVGRRCRRQRDVSVHVRRLACRVHAHCLHTHHIHTACTPHMHTACTLHARTPRIHRLCPGSESSLATHYTSTGTSTQLPSCSGSTPSQACPPKSRAR